MEFNNNNLLTSQIFYTLIFIFNNIHKKQLISINLNDG